MNSDLTMTDLTLLELRTSFSTHKESVLELVCRAENSAASVGVHLTTYWNPDIVMIQLPTSLAPGSLQVTGCVFSEGCVRLDLIPLKMRPVEVRDEEGLRTLQLTFSRQPEMEGLLRSALACLLEPGLPVISPYQAPHLPAYPACAIPSTYYGTGTT